jgi:two-component system chemotaxis response regulator CheY
MKPARVLIVDDSSVMRKIVGRSLRQAGVEVQQLLEASNGSEALTVAKENPLDLILSDINMPLMDGLEFVRQLRCIEAAQNIPVIMITTEAGEAHVVQALSCGASGYIRKPFTSEQIKERIIPLLGG